MTTKSYKLRLDLRANQPLVDVARFNSREVEVTAIQRWLDDTREAFNAGVDYLTGWLLRMRRGAGVWREKRNGIWREWREITTLKELEQARKRKQKDPDSYALLENRELLDAFMNEGKTEAEAVELAECCRTIVKEIARPAEPDQQTQMNRSDLDLLTLQNSEARGVREKSKTKAGTAKKTSGKRPGWLLEKAIHEECSNASSLDGLIERIVQRDEFRSAQKDGQKKINALRNKYGDQPWNAAKAAILEPHKDGRPKWEVAKQRWEEKRQKSEQSGAVAAYRNLLDANVLPLPGFHRPSDQLKLANCNAEWNYAMWKMAGQRVRSHLGWVRRRELERVIWELRKSLFEHGGWERTMRNGKKVTKEKIQKAVLDRKLKPEDFIRIENDAPPQEQIGDFKHRPAYANREWVKTLREYEEKEMVDHLGGVAFGAAEQPRIRKRTAKGWAKVRDKWIDLIDKASKAGKPVPSAYELLDAFDQMRTRKTRDFGDRRLFEWLASPERRWLWDGTDNGEDNDCGRNDRDCFTAFIAHNEHLADQPKSITWTQVDPIKHPVWPFFGENSAVKYWVTREQISEGKTRLVLVLKQLLARQADGSYSAVDRVKIALRGYEDFETSFALPDDATDVSAKQTLVFRDDLLGGQTRRGTLSGMKLTWERDELEASNRKCKPTNKPPRIYANFSCDTGEAALPEWLTKHVGSDVKLTKPRDGMTRAFFLKKTISKDDATEDGGSRLAPGQRKWPKEAIENGFTVRGTDLGYRTSSAGAWWRLSFTKPNGNVAWVVGTCDSKPIYAVLERTSTVSLPGDGETLPAEEQALRERLYSLRTRLNLNNAILRITRLLALGAITQRKPDGAKVRKRADGTTKRIGTKWKTETRSLGETEIEDNCRKAAEQLVRWSSTDAMTESLKAIGHAGSIWDWLGSRNASLKALAEKVPTTEVPTEKQAKEQDIDRDTAKARRQEEDKTFAQAVYELRIPLAKALCDGYDAEKRRRATAGLWYEFDAALMREVSYGNRGERVGRRDIFDDGLLRLLRRPPVTKHGDRKDEANNLPHGMTHRGGLSMNRLNFLDDVKNFVRRWSCRPRWPGDVRRVARDAKVNRGDTEHLDHLREHRAKLIAHADVAQTLGFEQDLRRGLWRYRDKSGQLLWHRPERGHWYREQDGRLVQCQLSGTVCDADARHPQPAYAPAHVLVYEDLTRYRTSSDRPKNENAGLARWSHRRILAFAQHIGGLFGVPVATVDARFSSRYCSHCGAPGCRAVRFDPCWLNLSWMQRVLQSSDIRDAAMKSVANDVRSRMGENPHAFDREKDRPWVLRDGGTHFVCANANCSVHSMPINADENAAANIGLRFLRGIDGIRVTISGNGAVVRSIGFVEPDAVLAQVVSGDAPESEPYWHNVVDGSRSSTRSAKGRNRTRSESTAVSDTEADDDESGGVRVLFRDPSGGFRANDRWFEGKVFWGAVAKACAKGIKATNASRFGSDEAD